MIRTLTVFAATSFLSVALACGGEKTADGKSGCPMAAAQQAQASQKAVQDADGTKVALAVTGLTCGGCASGVQAALLKVEGVKAAFVSFESGTAEIAFDSGNTNPDALVNAIAAAGNYSAKKAETAIN